MAELRTTADDVALATKWRGDLSSDAGQMARAILRLAAREAELAAALTTLLSTTADYWTERDLLSDDVAEAIERARRAVIG